MKPPRRTILVAGIFHETHTFLPTKTGRADFERVIACEGDAILRRCRGDASPAGGFIEVADELGWRILPSAYYAAIPSGMVRDEVFDTFCRRLEMDLRQPFDAIFLILHGAMVCESHFDPEGEVLQRIRASLQKQKRTVPIAGVLDLHCNFFEAMAANSNILVSYRENPHTDARETSIRAARLLARALEEKPIPRMVNVHLPMMLPPTGTASAGEPMKSVLAAARRLEAAHPELLAVNVIPGFAYSDIPKCGFDVSCSTVGDPRKAKEWMRDLARLTWSLREKGNLLDPPVDEVMRKALKIKEGPILLVEPSDNAGGGTPMDGTGVLSAFLRHRVQNAAVILNDPEVASACRRHKVGDVFHVKVGGKADNFHGETLSLEVKLRKKTDGKFTLENPKSHLASVLGMRVDMGPTVTIQCAGVTIVVSSSKIPPWDLGQLRSQGVTPEKCYMINVKAAAAHRAAYDPIAKHSFYVDTPGLGSSNLKNFDYRHVPRPIFPLDPFPRGPEF